MTSTQAMLCALAGFFAWVLTDTGIKIGSQAALSPYLIMAIVGMMGALSMVGSALLKRDITALRPHNWRGQVANCAAAIVLNYCNVIALKYLPLTLFYLIIFMIPLAVAGLSVLLKQEKLTPIKILCLIAGFGGVVLAIAPHSGDSPGEWQGYVSASISVVAFAVSTIAVRKLSQTDTVESIQFPYSLAVAIVGILGSLHLSTVPDSRIILIVIGAGLINIFGNVLNNKALQYTTSTNVSQLHYTQITFGALLGYLLWHEVPTGNLIAGSVIIIASGMIVAAQARKNQAA